jgi:hypothetical protein
LKWGFVMLPKLAHNSWAQGILLSQLSWVLILRTALAFYFKIDWLLGVGKKKKMIGCFSFRAIQRCAYC